MRINYSLESFTMKQRVDWIANCFRENYLGHGRRPLTSVDIMSLGLDNDCYHAEHNPDLIMYQKYILTYTIENENFAKRIGEE